MSAFSDAIVIGAGVAGLAAARGLQEAGLRTLVVEKSRGVGGRCATRRWEGHPIDHGAQYFTAHPAAFETVCQTWREQGIVTVWTRQLHQWQGGMLSPDPSTTGRDHLIAPCGMSGIGKALAASLHVRLQQTVTRIDSDGEGWRITLRDEAAPLRTPLLICTAPTPQVAAWFDTSRSLPWHVELLTATRSISTAPCLALLVEQPEALPVWQGMRIEDPTLAWIAHDSSKPGGRPPGRFVIHATSAFSRQFQDAAPGRATELMLARANAITDNLFPAPRALQLHRWRYARVEQSYPCSGALRIPSAPWPLVLAGDGFTRGRVGSAWDSGRIAAALAVGWPE